MEGLSQTREGLRQVDEHNPDYQHLHGLYETSGHYLGFTYGENHPQGYGPHVVPEPSGQYQYMSPISHINPFQSSQESPQYGNLFANCYHPSLDSNFPVNRNNSVVRFDINLPWDENETEPVVQQDEDVQRRPSRNRQAPGCGTGGRRGHPH